MANVQRCIRPDKFYIITGRNEVVAKVIFLHLSVIHSVHGGGGGGSASVHAGIPPPPGADPPGADPPGADPPGADTPQEQRPPQTRPPGAEIPPDQTPPPQSRPPRSRHHPPPREANSSIWSTSGRYASYWNAFLFYEAFLNFFDISLAPPAGAPPKFFETKTLVGQHKFVGLRQLIIP